jgi:hypothetical protein
VSFCPQCGSSTAADARFCSSCGTQLAEQGSSTQVTGSVIQAATSDDLLRSKASYSKIAVISLSILLLLVLGAGAFMVAKHQAALAARKAEVTARLAQAKAKLDALSEQFDTLTEQQTHITDLESQYDLLDDTYRATRSDAYAAMEARHLSTDESVSEEQAKKELAGVNALQEQLPERRSSLDAISDAYAEALGPAAVTAFRNDAEQVIQTESLGLNRWWRAINDISEALSGGSYPTENIEQLYDQSGDYDTRAETQADELVHQWTGLQKQLDARINEASGKISYYFSIIDQSQRSSLPDVVKKTWKLDHNSYYPSDVYSSDAAFAAAADRAIEKLAAGKVSPWFARFGGAGSPIALIQDPTLAETLAFFQICKPHDCSTTLYGIYDLSTKDMCAALYDDDAKAATTACDNDYAVSALNALRIRFALGGAAGRTSLLIASAAQ